MPQVLNIKTSGVPAGAVYIGRKNTTYGVVESEWHNPFPLKNGKTRQEVLDEYKEYLNSRPDLLARVGELRGKDLVCWCAPHACHGDILLELANKEAAKMHIIAVTGHREVGGTTGITSIVTQTVQKLSVAINTHGIGNVGVWCGMAKGVDSIVAEVCSQMGVKWNAAVPHIQYRDTYFKPGAERQAFDELLAKANKRILVVQDQHWHFKHNFTRNHFMVDRAHVVWAYTNRDMNWVTATSNTSGKGGTAECIKYALSQHKPIEFIHY